MNVGTLSLHRFNGTERFSIESAELFLLKGGDDSVCSLLFEFEAADTPLATLPDTESLRAVPNGEFSVEVVSLDEDDLVGRAFSIPDGDIGGGWLARIYYVAHDAVRDWTLRVLERNGSQFRVSIEGFCTDVNYYDGSKSDTRLILDAWFALRPSQSSG
jgi:hypothetical protein